MPCRLLCHVLLRRQRLLKCCRLPLLVLLQQALQRGVWARRQRHGLDGLSRHQGRPVPCRAACWGRGRCCRRRLSHCRCKGWRCASSRP